MAIGEKNHFFRIMRGMTKKKYFGTLVGFLDRSTDIRLAQYETDSHKPKADLTATLEQALDVANIGSYIGFMHTLFTLEDIYCMITDKADGEIYL